MFGFIKMKYEGSTKERLDRIETIVNKILTLQGVQMAAAADLEAKIATLTTDVATMTNAQTAAVTLLNGLSALIAGLKAGVTDPAQLAAIDALSTQVATNASTLAAAVTANTPPA